MAWRTWPTSAVVGLTLFGCGPAKLYQEKAFTLTLENGSVGYDAPAQSSGQVINVAVTSDGPVDVYVVTGMSAADAAAEHELSGKAVASKTEVTEHTLTAAIPAGQKPAVVVRLGAKTTKASGKVKMTN